MKLKQELCCRTLGCKMGFAVKGMIRLLKKRFAEEDIKLTIDQYFTLNIIESDEGLILQELAEIVDRDKSAVLRQIDKLESNHFLARAKDPDDKRRKILLVTKPGIDVLERARKIDKDVNEELLDHIPQEEIEYLDQFFSELYENALSKAGC
ncbi:MarR family winged helix-turn-helix transcriptional regulator [Fodinibius halophilus]|uniref:MarR family transcriptional regulator n=1 Tax=Fodinibius halophilus TaxID=1736908 RepID=A0A6M1SZW4_9BACT|nr:MarR family transcriptional regulator [Fodinibius halophilus]NGP87227.1 MarR family transcriptional regulator [Fodinibius halophilus]